MLRKTSAQELVGKFRRNEEGQVAVIFGLAILPIFAAVGAAVDYSHSNQVRTGLQKAMDSPVLAAAIDASPNWQTAALNAFKGNLNAKDSSVGTPIFSLQKDIYSGSVPAVTQTSFIRIVGIDSVALTANSAASTANIASCVLRLNAFDKGAFDMNGNSKF